MKITKQKLESIIKEAVEDILPGGQDAVEIDGFYVGVYQKYGDHGEVMVDIKQGHDEEGFESYDNQLSVSAETWHKIVRQIDIALKNKKIGRLN